MRTVDVIQKIKKVINPVTVPVVVQRGVEV
jgi:hypothetical protein